jgi:N-acetylglutamate synthase-like GNAT family acetyltransferase
MDFTQAKQSDIENIIEFIKEEKEQGLATDYIPSNITNFYIGRENESGKIIVCGGHVKTLFSKAEEIRGVVTRPKNAFVTKQINNFLCEQAREHGNIAAYAVIDPTKPGMADYIQFLKIANEFEEVTRLPPIKMVIPRYASADPKEYTHKMLLIRYLS